MSLKQEIETWVAALAAYDNTEFDASLKCFQQIADTSKILFNIGVINATLGQHAQAVDCYQRAVQLDQYLAVAYFQQGVSNFLMGDFEEALANFNDTLLYLRGNNNIDYEQLGLKFKLYSCQVLFNRGLCYIYLQQKDVGMQDLIYAAKEKMVPDHDVIDEAIKEQAEGYTVFSIPMGILYRPNEAKVKNLKTKDYLGKARLVAAQDSQNVDSRRAALAAMARDDRPGEKLSYGALNLVRPDLRSRGSRQQSAPPLNRNVFPPTPPPEPDHRPESAHERDMHKHRSAESSTSTSSSSKQARTSAKPLRLDLGAAAFEQSVSPEKPRPGNKRAESERPTARRLRSDESSRRKSDRTDQRDIPEVHVQEDPIEAYSEQASAPQRPPNQRARSSAHALNYLPISEEDEGDESHNVADEPLAFEIVPPKSSSHHRHRSQSRRPPPPELRNIRIKVHVADDTRYVMAKPSVTYFEFTEQIRTKFSLTNRFKLKMKDEEGDLVTIGDQDDLDHAVTVCGAAAAKERVEMGKMDMWLQEI
ncbi:hypothetical protein BAUCODRAFT_255450 [Baudoinia panamericana UAMH 10762]|uniref:PB1 domain-containing protein n=1 Tax=Baudoinia panamericana (strain UAMH 10762) TaxID=717646 RepID=M2M8D1_BAUPA|nr:uncharacterized protein BAUCODRAFT_255450 [Baudoinia panamericana UAMH 10762]EMC92626.1 hypothetical protein BAUCODRAFT_255450 [Baudoinia panamericana UAMH 10762]